MTPSVLYRDPVPVNPVLHRNKRVSKLTDFSVAKAMHAVFLAAAEFEHAALEYVIVFVHSGDDPDTGTRRMAPIVLLGLNLGENLFIDGSRWDSHYMPAFIRRYPFWAADLPGGPADGPTIYIDAAWSGWSDTAGDRVFEADGTPAPAFTRAIEFMRAFESEVQRTNALCAVLVEHDLLRDMKADATLPDGTAVALNGFFAVDPDKLNALPDAAVIELHRNGILGLLNMHLLSLGNLRTLIDRKVSRLAASPVAA